MLADQLDYIVGVDPHRDSHALAVVHVVSGAVVFESTVLADSDGYADALKLAEAYAPGRRAFAIEGTGSYGRGLTRYLTGRGERVLEVGRLRRERRSGGKTDELDAARAARGVLAQKRTAAPRAGGERQALLAVVAAKEGAVNAKRAGLCQLRDLLITTPEPLRSELRPLTRARLLQRLAATRPHPRQDAELRGSLLALRSIARRVLQLTAEERELAREIETLTRRLARQLLDQPGVGPHAAAQIVLSWSIVDLNERRGDALGIEVIDLSLKIRLKARGRDRPLHLDDGSSEAEQRRLQFAADVDYLADRRIREGGHRLHQPWRERRLLTPVCCRRVQFDQ
jgi:transposase